jgi:hypothetical protein
MKLNDQAANNGDADIAQMPPSKRFQVTTELYLTGTGVTDAGLKELATLENLTILHIIQRDCRFVSLLTDAGASL